ncbi:MAG: diaminopimelate epimerase, partial [Candidatus Hydrogenedentes bacterium]|nr:diaminopimelate epimerase [Candidatus Hydrogenedentota bacterium]
MCGNGIRCLAKYVYDNRMTDKDTVTIETPGGIKTIRMFIEDGTVRRARVNMGTPALERGAIPMKGAEGRVIAESLEVDGQTYLITCVSMGNPHAVIFVDDVRTAPVDRIGPQIEIHPKFPNKVNVEFVEPVDEANIKMRVWERGSGETLACGSGCCAAAVASARTGRADRSVSVHLALGHLQIEWANDGHVYMAGPAVRVFDGEWTAPR